MAKRSLERARRSRESGEERGRLPVPCRRQFVEVRGMAELARSDAVDVFRQLEPGNGERGPQWSVLLILVSVGHTQAVFGVVTIVFDATHRLVPPSARYRYNDRKRLQGCYADSTVYVDTFLGRERGRNTVGSRQ